MKELKKIFEGRGEVKGWLFTQLEAHHLAYLYEKSKEGRLSYEVFKRRENTQYGVISYPSSKAFGKWAWEYQSKEDAMRKFNALKVAKNKL